MKKILFLLLITSLFLKAEAQQEPFDSLRWHFDLGEIQVVESRLYIEQGGGTVSAVSYEQMRENNATQVAEALNVLPGVTQNTVGAKNENMLYVRGFDLRQVPVFLDGIPVYVPYEGYIDLGRFSPAGLAEIQVHKGFASLLFGANVAGGAVNLISRKPTKKLELDANLSYFTDQAFQTGIYAGSRVGKFYFRAGFSFFDRDYFNVSNNFSPVEAENGGKRENSFNQDLKWSMKIGFVPNSKHEIALGFVSQNGKKGQPLYTGDNPFERLRYWRWPVWKKQSLYLLSKSEIGQAFYLKTRWFYDRFENQLSAYDDETYTTQTRGYAFTSFYDDYALGTSLEMGVTRWRAHKLKAGLYYKADHHKERNKGEPWRNFADHTLSVSLEDVFQIVPRLKMIPGIGIDFRQSLEAENFDPQSGEISAFAGNQNAAFNAQIGLFYELNSDSRLHLTFANRHRLPTLKDRYSYRIGRALPNPELEPEQVLLYDAGFSGLLHAKSQTKLGVSVFFSQLNDVIQQVDNVGENGEYQFQNAGKAHFFGTELSLKTKPLNWLQAGANYTFTRRENISNPDLKFVDLPEHQAFAYLKILFLPTLSWRNSFEYASERLSTSNGEFRAAGFALWHTSLNWEIYQGLSLKTGVHNLLDKNYALAEGYPAQGRYFHFGLRYRL